VSRELNDDEVRRPRLLDLFCGQGGAGWGYHLAGFDVTGIDIRPMPRHPQQMAFVHGDALEYLEAHGHEYDAVHASPPCSPHTKARGGAPVRYRHEDFLPRTRKALRALTVPWVIENVPGARMVYPVTLCGAMFGLRLYRHRQFETGGGLRLTAPVHPVHVAPSAKMGRPAAEGEFLSVVGNFSGVEDARRAMEMAWADQDGLRQAVPPAYTRWIGLSLMSESL
jgi:DNA (cytosine-5)-methyltransferase 1